MARATQSPTVSVIVPCHNDESRIGLCIESLLAQDQSGHCVEIIVVDNGSTDRSCEVVRAHPDVILLIEHRPGSYAARNTGLARVRGDIVAFTDSDCIADPHWIANGVARFQREPEADVIVGAITVFPRDANRPTAVEALEMAVAFPQSHYARSGWGATANLLARAEVFRQFGRFDAALQSGGDREWGERVSSAGVRVRFDPSVIVHHPARRTWDEIARKQRRVALGLSQRGATLTVFQWIRSLLGIAKDLAAILRSREVPLRFKTGASVMAVATRVHRAFLTRGLVQVFRVRG